MPVVRNPQFYFKEGFCWTDINSTFLKARLKCKDVFDVVSMSLFSKIDLPDWYFVTLINTTFISFYVDNFINNTSHFQINDARQTPIIIPAESDLAKLKKIFDKAYNIKKQQFSSVISSTKADEMLLRLQKKLDNLVENLYSI
ncbi:hypothetical protein [Treponema socranskii]|uniref:hypothetical protein n=1 Tax=Treponema socranskii TaxID=53419 RepID=UPI0023F40883|nr:hypothetical protein [Treponema socranskii]